MSIAIPFGLLFVFLIPPFQALDEQSHYLRAYQIKEGSITAEKTKPLGAGGQLPKNLGDSAYDLLSPRAKNEEPKRYELSLITKYLTARPNSTIKAQYLFPNTALYSPAVYAPYIISLFFTDNILHIGMIPMFYVARLVGFAFWVGGIFLAIRVIPFGKWVVLCIALIPASMYGACTVNADTVTFTLVALFVAYTLRLYRQHKLQVISLKQAGILAAILVAIGLAKPVYCTVSPLVLLLCRHEAKSIRHRLLIGLLVALPFVVTAAWTFTVKDFVQANIDIFRYGEHIDVKDQILTMLRNPAPYLTALLLFLLTNDGSKAFIEMIGSLGWSEYPLPVWMVVLSCMLLAVSLLHPFEGELRHINYGKRTRFVTAGLIAVALISVITIMYLTWTPVGAREVQGVQGRYYLPVLFLLIVPFAYSALGNKGKDKTFALLLVSGNAFILTMTLALIIIHFWV